MHPRAVRLHTIHPRLFCRAAPPIQAWTFLGCRQIQTLLKPLFARGFSIFRNRTRDIEIGVWVSLTRATFRSTAEFYTLKGEYATQCRHLNKETPSLFLGWSMTAHTGRTKQSQKSPQSGVGSRR